MQSNEKNVVEEAIEEAKKAAQEAETEEVETTETEEVTEEEVAEDETDEDASEESDEKKGFFKKKKDKRDEQIAELTDKNTRMLAEFENFRNRSEKEKAAMYGVGAKSVIEKILPVIDNFERGLMQKPEDEASAGFVTGVEMVYKQMVTALEELGVTPIEAVGAEFNPDFHNAVMHVEDENLGTNIVAEEFQKGYMYKDQVVRPSMVKVAN